MVKLGGFIPLILLKEQKQMTDKFDVPDETPVEAPSKDLSVASAPAHNVKISSEEWLEISLALEPHHAVFYKVWQMGKPVFNEKIETAAVQFDENGDFIWFHFNPTFWKRMQFKDKLFVICHEALHIVLNHGIRTKDAGMNHRATNVALDIVVNHSLVNNFGFTRTNIEGQEDYCWVDTVFAGRKSLPPDNEMYEYYYNLFDKVYGDFGMGEGDGDGPGLVDEHDMMGEESGNWGKVIDKLNESLSEEEKESLKQTVNKHFEKEKPNKKDPQKNTPAGTGTGGQWVFAGVTKVKKKKKWETVIKKWSKKYLIEKDRDHEQWARINRRMVMLPKDMFLPTEMEIDDDREKTRIKVWFFLDTSGSCWGLKDRFFTAALSLPTERFDVRLFCFDTTVQETTLESRKIYGGGGTSFSILEAEIQKELQKGGHYPEAVFVITDGYGDQIKPAHPNKWYWFITAGGTQNYIDKTCNFFRLEDFE